MLRSRFHLMTDAPMKCCICLDEFSSPASLPCGHCFCLSCVGEYWKVHGVCQCPLCRAVFLTRPRLKTYQTPPGGAETEEAKAPLKSGEVPCDLCPEKHRAVKSCLECMSSYCSAHLEPHYLDEDLVRHPLVSLVKNLEDSVCALHGKQLNRFCRSDQTCICAVCTQADHRGHHISSVNKESRRKKAKLKCRLLKLRKVLQDRLSEVERIKLSADVSRGTPREARAQTNELRQLEEEIVELQRRNVELETLSDTEDNLHFLQRFLHTASSL